MKKFLVKNLRLKALALGFAIALWFFVAGQRDTEMGFIVTLGFKGIPKNMVMTSTPPSDVEVRVTGPKLIIGNLSPAQIVAELDLDEAKEGMNSYRLTPGDISTPTGVAVSWVRPGSFDIRLERIISVRLPVKVKLKGRPAKGYRLVSATPVPEVIDVSGLKKDVVGMDSVSTRQVDIKGLDAEKSVPTEIDLPRREFRLLNPDRVDVRLVIEKEQVK